jgi:uracil-DNA glycosylase family 4
MNARKLAYLNALEIDVWQRRDLVHVAAPPSVEDAAVAETEVSSTAPVSAPIRPAGAASDLLGTDVSALSWDELQARVRGCTLCPLHVTRTQAVFGVGNRTAKWMVIGEAPGADEDRQGEPFVGRAGQLLNSMLKAIGFKREQVFIANILKSRPPNNRDPRPDEVRACLPYLYRQIELVDPKLILCVGRIAAQTLLETDTPIGKLRGKLHHIAGGRPMIVTYHPAYLLRSPGEKRKAWGDLMLAVKTYESLGGTLES